MINKRRNGWYYESKILPSIGSLFGRVFLFRKGLRREETGKKLDRGSRHDGPSNKSLDYLIDSFNSVHARMGFTAHIFSLLAIWLSSALSEETTEAYHGPIPLCSHSLSECFMSGAIKAVLIVSFFSLCLISHFPNRSGNNG